MTKQQKPKSKAKRKVKKSGGLYSNISPDKPLTPKEKVFVSEYVRTRNGSEAVRNAKFSVKNAKEMAYKLINLKPNTKKAIENRLNRYFDRLDVDAFDVIKRISNIAMTDADRLIPIIGGRVSILDTANLPEDVRALYAGAEERINERGDVTIKVNTHDQLKALELLCKYFGILEKARQAKQTPLIEQQKAMEAILTGEKTVVDVALELEMQGVPLPDTIRILLSKQSDDDGDKDDDSVVIPTAEEMDRKMQDRLSEINNQKETFLPKRQKEIRDLKETLGKQNEAFSGGGDGESPEK